jgi:hypothetical protein
MEISRIFANNRLPDRGVLQQIPGTIMDEILQRLEWENKMPSPSTNLCNGTLLSRNQFTSDIESAMLLDARLTGRSVMTPEEIKARTLAGEIEQRRLAANDRCPDR